MYQFYSLTNCEICMVSK